MSEFAGPTVIATTDEHAGHNLGLQNPATRLHELDEDGLEVEKDPGMTHVQTWLWKQYIPKVEQAMKIAGPQVILLELGDICHGDKHMAGVKTTRKADQVDLAAGIYEAWLPYADRIKAVLFLQGTSAHNFGEGTAEVLLLRRLRSMFPIADVRVLHHGLLSVSGVEFDVSHHGPSGGNRAWLEGNILRLYIKSLMMGELMVGREPPHFVLRAHHHVERFETVRVLDKVGKLSMTQGILLPAFCGITHFGRQRAQSPDTLRCGIYVFRCLNGAAETYRLITTKDLRTKVSY